MKLTALLLSLCLAMNVFAGSIQPIERELDEYQYALTVEWDQKDQVFYEAQTAQFIEKVTELMKQEGITSQEVVALVEKKTVDKGSLEALKLRLTLAGEAKSQTELIQIMKESSKDFYAQGASWHGRIDRDVVLVGLLFAAIIGYAVWFDANYDCVAWTQEWRCSSSTSYDSYGSYTTQTCGWHDVCAQYVKKQK